MNALKHGLRAELAELLPGEDADAFNQKVQLWVAHYAPADIVEAQLVRQAAVLSWKIDRADHHEFAIHAVRAEDLLHDCQAQGFDTLTRDQASLLTVFDPSDDQERLRRYQFSLQRALIRTLDTLSKLRTQAEKARKGSQPRPSEPKTISPIEPKAVATPEPKTISPIEPKSAPTPEPKTISPIEPKSAATSEPISRNISRDDARSNRTNEAKSPRTGWEKRRELMSRVGSLDDKLRDAGISLTPWDEISCMKQ
jgi:hypothetical protein